MKQQNKPGEPKYTLSEHLPDNSILGAIGTEEIKSNGVAYTDDFVTEFAKMVARYFKDNPDKVQDK